MNESRDYTREIIKGIGIKIISALVLITLGTLISVSQQWQPQTWETVIGNIVLIAAIYFVFGGLAEFGHKPSSEEEREEIGSLLRAPVQLIAAGLILLIFAVLSSFIL
ncbi:MAG: hypothetical protein ACFFCQ_19020 [Promethearchaeota archaeon]